jgi:putative phage-type endonuclease
VTIATGTTITPANHAEWLAVRQSSLGASEAATALGLNPWETRLQLYLRKLGLADPTPETPAMRWGTRLEPLLAEEYSRETGFSFVAEQLFVRDPVRVFMSATLDRVREDGRILELKTCGARGAAEWGEPGSDEVPPRYIAQVMHQLIVTGTEIADLAVLIAGQDFRVYSIERDDAVADRIVKANAEMWDRVQRRDPPPIDPSRDAGALARLYPRAEGEAELDPVGLELAERWESLGKEIRDRQDSRDRAKCRLLDILGEAATARLADGKILSRKVISIPEREVKQRAYSYTDLRILRGANR